MKKIIKGSSIFLIIFLLLVGCVPKQYTKGIITPKSFLQGNIQVYDDAILFDKQEEDDTLELSFGSKEDNKSIINFYNDDFQELCVFIDEQSNSKISGAMDGYEFEINVDEPDCFYCKRKYESVIKVNINYSVDGKKSYKYGEYYRDIDEYKQAMIWYELSAKENIPEAHCEIGEMYLYGNGVQKDNEIAAEWFDSAFELGYAKAIYLKAAIYQENTDLYNVIECTKKAADAGYAQAQCEMGVYLLKGLEGYFDIDQFEAFKWLQKSAEQGLASAQYNLGYCYKYGYGVEPNQQLAEQWYLKAAAQNHVMSYYELGISYYDLHEYDLAIEWLRKGSEEGNLKSAFALANILAEFGDYSEAFELFLYAAEEGHMYAQELLANYYIDGLGVEKDDSKGVYWHTKSAEQGNGTSMTALGYACENGISVPVDLEQALYWHQLALENDTEEYDYSLQSYFRLMLLLGIEE